MEKLIKEFVELCKDFKKFSYKKNGWKCAYYDNRNVDCYFAIDGNHTAVTIDGIQVQFHSIPKIEIQAHRLTSQCLEKVILKYRGILNELKIEYSKKTQLEKEAEKIKRIEDLKQQLEKELKNL